MVSPVWHHLRGHLQLVAVKLSDLARDHLLDLRR
jgi:hypothetical protein